jgi:hypothetical protein
MSFGGELDGISHDVVDDLRQPNGVAYDRGARLDVQANNETDAFDFSLYLPRGQRAGHEFVQPRRGRLEINAP